MYGKNAIEGYRDPRKGLLVKDIFYTIQGEGPWSGRPAIFLRLAGCNLRCFFCDTDFSGGETLHFVDVRDRLLDMQKKYGCSTVVITGGEPLLQGIGFLTRLMPDWSFQVETAGTVAPPGFIPEDFFNTVFVCSPKTPVVHPFIRGQKVFWKYIIRHGETSEDDGLPTGSTQFKGKATTVARPSPGTPRSAIYVQPCDEGHGEDGEPAAAGASYMNTQATKEVAMQFGYRISLQIHKLLALP